MIDLASIESLIELYSSHDWTPQRILLRSDESSALLDELKAAFRELEIRPSDINAIWFSRPNNDAQSWELRRIDGLPYALVRFVPGSASTEERESILSEAEIEIEASRRVPTEH